MVYPEPIDPYFFSVILIPEPHFPQNFDPWALIKELIPSMFLHKILNLGNFVYLQIYNIGHAQIGWWENINFNFSASCISIRAFYSATPVDVVVLCEFPLSRCVCYSEDHDH